MLETQTFKSANNDRNADISNSEQLVRNSKKRRIRILTANKHNVGQIDIKSVFFQLGRQIFVKFINRRTQRRHFHQFVLDATRETKGADQMRMLKVDVWSDVENDAGSCV